MAVWQWFGLAVAAAVLCMVVRVQQPKPEETAPQPQKPAEDIGTLPNPDDFDAPKVQREPEERPPEDTAPEKTEKKGFFKKLFGK